MRKAYVILLSGIVALSCRDYRSTRVLDKIYQQDSLCDSNPVQALKDLDSLSKEVMSGSEYVMRRWQLSKIRAHDKANHPFSSDSLINVLVSYFERKGNVDDKVMAYYYQGRTYAELHDTPSAVKSFLKAFDFSEKNEIPNQEILACICSQLSYLFLRQLNFEEALAYARRGYEVSKAGHILVPTTIADVASAYQRMNKGDSAEYYYNQSLAEIVRSDKIGPYADVIGELLNYYAYNYKKEKADECKELLNELSEDMLPMNYTGAMSAYYEVFGPVDSVVYYCNLNLETTSSFYAKRAAARVLMDIYDSLHLYNNASRYARIYMEANDSITALLKMEQTRDTHNEYKYRRNLEEESLIRQKMGKMKRTLIIVVTAFLLTLLAVALYVVNRKRLFAESLLQKNRLIEEQRQTIANDQEMLTTQERQLKEHQMQKDDAVMKLLENVATNYAPDIIKRFKDAAIGRRTVAESDWKQLIGIINDLYPTFCKSVFERHPNIKEKDFHVVLLMKAGMEPAEIMAVTGIPKSSLYRKVGYLRNIFGDLLDA